MRRLLVKWDWAILDGINRACSCKTMDAVMPRVSMLGNGGMIWLAIAGILLFIESEARLGMRLFCGLAIGVLICNLLLKPLVRRLRPCWLNDQIRPIITTPTDFSFPSGHTLSSAIAATILAIASPLYAAIAVPVALAIAFSRLYLYVHFPSDVLSATVIGATIGAVSYLIPLPLAIF